LQQKQMADAAGGNPLASLMGAYQTGAATQAAEQQRAMAAKAAMGSAAAAPIFSSSGSSSGSGMGTSSGRGGGSEPARQTVVEYQPVSELGSQQSIARRTKIAKRRRE
jgi:hypothetical protein